MSQHSAPAAVSLGMASCTVTCLPETCRMIVHGSCDLLQACLVNLLGLGTNAVSMHSVSFSLLPFPLHIFLDMQSPEVS